MALPTLPSRLARLVPWVLLATTAAAASPPATAPADLQSWVEQLDAPDPADRVAAERCLATTGRRAVAVLLAAQDDPRPEVAARARRALRRVRLFTLRTGTDLDAALALADQYLSTDARANREAIIRQLAAAPPVPADVLVGLFSLEPDTGLRAELLAIAGATYRSTVPRLLAGGDAAALPPLLEQAVPLLPNVGVPDVAAEAFLTGQRDDAVARWRAELANGDAAHQAQAAAVLCYLYRAAGQPGDAADMAARSGDWGLVLSTAIDRGDWRAAAGSTTGWTAGEGAPMRAALGTLAGTDPASVARALSADADAFNADAGSIGIGRVKLLLGAVDDGLAKLSDDPTNGGDPAAALRLRQARGEYDAALALGNRFAHDPTVGPAVTVLRDDLRRLLGEVPTPPTARTPSASDIDPAWGSAVANLAAHRYAAAAADLAAGDGDPSRIDWWYVRGFALSAAGDAAHGGPLMRSATLAPLADEAARGRLAERLSAAGLDGAAAEQLALAAHLANPFHDSSGLLDLYLTQESVATAARDHATAAAAAERVWLMSFWPRLAWKNPAAYLTVPADVHLARARVARSHDDWPTAMREIDAYHAFLPTSADVPLEWVPLLDARGDHAAADAMFATAYEPLDAQSVRHPRSPFLHNQSAWLAACCCRRLDGALAHAESAVRLAPADWQYTDTLAEVRFRLGDRSAATDLERRAATLAGADTAYVARQLARFAKCEVPSTTRPSDPPS